MNPEYIKCIYIVIISFVSHRHAHTSPINSQYQHIVIQQHHIDDQNQCHQYNSNKLIWYQKEIQYNDRNDDTIRSNNSHSPIKSQ